MHPQNVPPPDIIAKKYLPRRHSSQALDYFQRFAIMQLIKMRLPWDSLRIKLRLSRVKSYFEILLRSLRDRAPLFRENTMPIPDVEEFVRQCLLDIDLGLRRRDGKESLNLIDALLGNIEIQYGVDVAITFKESLLLHSVLIAIMTQQPLEVCILRFRKCVNESFQTPTVLTGLYMSVSRYAMSLTKADQAISLLIEGRDKVSKLCQTIPMSSSDYEDDIDKLIIDFRQRKGSVAF